MDSSNKIVARTGFEPVISWMRTRYPRPLDERAKHSVILSEKASWVETITSGGQSRNSEQYQLAPAA